MSPPPKKS